MVMTDPMPPLLPTQSAPTNSIDNVVYEVVGVCNSHGWLHGRDHISDDAGKSTLCGLLLKSEGGRSDIICLQGGRCNGYVSWRTAFQCRRCEAARRVRRVPVEAI